MCCIFEYEWFIVAYACIFCIFWHAKIYLGLKGLCLILTLHAYKYVTQPLYIPGRYFLTFSITSAQVLSSLIGIVTTEYFLSRNDTSMGISNSLSRVGRNSNLGESLDSFLINQKLHALDLTQLHCTCRGHSSSLRALK